MLKKMQKNRTAGILGLGMYVPEKIVTNQDLEKIVETSDEWITSRTGMKERHYVAEGQATSDLAIEAGKRALENAGVKPEEIDLVIVATTTSNHLCPSTAGIVQHGIGAVNAGAFDLSAACSGFVYSTVIASQMIISGFYKRILIIGAESISPFLDPTDRNTLILFGDGAGAVVLGDVPEGEGYISGHLGADGSGFDNIIIPGGGSWKPFTDHTSENREQYLKMSGSDVFKFAVKKVPEVIGELLQKADLTEKDIDLFVLHQANLRIIESVAKRMKTDLAKFPVNIEEYGNTSSASIPILLDELNKTGRFHKGQKIVLCGFGAGLTWGATLIEW